MRSKNDKKNRAIEHIGRVQRNKYDEIRYLERHSKTFATETMLPGIVTVIPPC